MTFLKAPLLGLQRLRVLSPAAIFCSFVSGITSSTLTVACASDVYPALVAAGPESENAKSKAPRFGEWPPEKKAWLNVTLCIREGRIAELKELLVANPDFVTRTGNDGSTLLHGACGMDQVEAAELLLQLGADPLAKQGKGAETPLHVAARRDAVNCVKLLLQEGIDIDIPCEGPPPNQDQFAPYASPLDLAAASGAVRTVRLLLDNGAKLDINPVDHPYSALHRAAEGRYITFDKRSQVMNDPVRKTAFGNVSVFKLLLKHGAHVDDVDYQGNTAFDVTVRQAADETVEYLLAARQFDINVEAPGQSGCTPLQLAVQEVRPYNQKNVALVIELLRKRGADRHKLGGTLDRPMTAFDYATERKCPEPILKLLRP